jgi:hypothetical protein
VPRSRLSETVTASPDRTGPILQELPGKSISAVPPMPVRADCHQDPYTV